jgi:hypothetical protein
MLRVDLTAVPVEPPADLLPACIDTLLRDPPLNSQWIPEVHSVAAHLAAYDLRFGDDWDAAEQHIYSSNRALLESPLYRALFRLASPGLLLRGAQWRWGQLHKGVDLTANVDASGLSGHITLSYPHALFTSEFVQGIGMGIKALLEANGMRAIKHELVEYGPQGAVIAGDWSESAQALRVT